MVYFINSTSPSVQTRFPSIHTDTYPQHQRCRTLTCGTTSTTSINKGKRAFYATASRNGRLQQVHVQKGEWNSTINLSSEKPIVRMPGPQDFNRQLLLATNQVAARKDTLSSDAERSRRWTTATKVATNEYALPTQRYSVPDSTLEMCADAVRYRARETGPWPSLWQMYTREWDMKQLRHPPKKAGINLPDISKNYSVVKVNSELQSLPKLTRQFGVVMDFSGHHEAKDKALFTRPMPGYGGFVPHHPVDPKPIADEDCVTASMCSTSRRTYRSYPPEEYKELDFAHRGPLSKTITQTAPFNPFNKVEQC